MTELRTPRTLSPYMLIQEFLRDNPWQLLAACIMLNQTTAKQVWKILPDFFERYHGPGDFILADEKDVKALIKPLGFQNRRYTRIYGMSVDFVTGVPVYPEQTGFHRGLFGIGKYGIDSYRIFCEGYLVQDVRDKELKNYVRWAVGQVRGEENRDSRSGGVQPDRQEGARTSRE